MYLQGAEEVRKVSIRTVEIAIGMARSMADGKTKWPFLGSCADLMQRMLEEIKQARKKEWQHLTDDEIKEIIGSYGDGIGVYTRELFDKIEAKIKEKNV